MKTNHTPGPWGVSKHAVPEYAFQAGIYQENDATRDLAIVKSGEADARLIAAAPDLLAALEWLLPHAVDLAQYARPDSTADAKLHECYAALAKALGN